MTEKINLVKVAASALRKGELVAFPTETVYGLGADARNSEALKKLFKLKGRPEKHPLIVHLKDASDLSEWCAELPDSALLLAKLFWPGPLTLVLKKSPDLSELVTGGQNTVALRVPGHPLALELLREFGSGIAAPSANRFGKVSPTSAEHVRAEFPDELAIVLDGGPCEIGIESTIVDLSSDSPRVLRPGMILKESIYLALETLGISNPDQSIENKQEAEFRQSASPRVPGSLKSHYAPQTETRLVKSDQFMKELDEFERRGLDTAVLSFKPAPSLHHKHKWISAKNYPADYAHNLYSNLRELDSKGADLILVESPPENSQWEAILDRLRRAACTNADKKEEEALDG